MNVLLIEDDPIVMLGARQALQLSDIPVLGPDDAEGLADLYKHPGILDFSEPFAAFEQRMLGTLRDGVRVVADRAVDLRDIILPASLAMVLPEVLPVVIA